MMMKKNHKGFLGIFLFLVLSVSISYAGIGNLSLQQDEDIVPLNEKDGVALPFAEDWSQGSFETNGWILEANQQNWQIDMLGGNNAPSAKFDTYPYLTNYSLSLTSPMLNATEISSDLVLSFDVGLYNASALTLEKMAVELSDGSEWVLVKEFNNEWDGLEWTSQTVDISEMAGGKSFQIRFRASGVNTASFVKWAVDNIKVYEDVKGTLSGTVTTLAENSPVQDAVVTVFNSIQGTLSATTDASGNYSFTDMVAGSVLIKCDVAGYNTYVNDVVVPENEIVTENIALSAPTLEVTPLELSAEVPVGQTLTQYVDIANNGNGPLEWSASLIDDNTTVKGTEKKNNKGYAFDLTAKKFYSFDMLEPSVITYISDISVKPCGATFDNIHDDIIYFIDLNDNFLKTIDIVTGQVTSIGVSNTTGNYYKWIGVTCDKVSGVLYGASTGMLRSQIYTINPETGESTFIGENNIKLLEDITIDAVGQMYGVDILDDVLFKIEKETGVAENIGSVGVDMYYAQGMGYDALNDKVYLASYSISDGAQLREVDLSNGSSTVLCSLPGEIDGLAFPGIPVQMVSFSPESGIVAAGESFSLPVVFNGDFLPLQKDFDVSGTLTIKSTPDVGTANVALSMTVISEVGGVSGGVSHGTEPVSGVLIHAKRNEIPIYEYETTSAEDGTYSLEGMIYGEYAITVNKIGYNPSLIESVEVENGVVTPLDIQVTAPQLSVSPLALEETLRYGEVKEQTIHLVNNGDGPLSWECNLPSDISVEKKCGVGYCFNLLNKNCVKIHPENPEQLFYQETTISPVAASFDTLSRRIMYVLEEEGEFQKFDLKTATAESIAQLTASEGEEWVGMACDKNTNVIYVASSSEANATLYTVDVTTGALTSVGVMNIPGLLDIAIDGKGQMYAFDYITDNSYLVNKDDGTSTVLGNIGYDAMYSQGMAWDPYSNNVYLTAYNFDRLNAQLRILDVLTGNTSLVDDLPDYMDGFAFPYNDWYNVNEQEGVLEAGSAVDITLTLDGNYFTDQLSLSQMILFETEPNVGADTLKILVTKTGTKTGNVHGVVSHDGLPLADAVVLLNNQGHDFAQVTLDDGVYNFDDVLAGNYILTVKADGYNSYLVDNMMVLGDDNIDFPVDLTMPVMTVEPDHVSVSLQLEQQGDEMVTFSNEGDGEVYWYSSLSMTNESGLKSNSAKELWDILLTFDCTGGGQAGVETDGDFIYTSTWNTHHGADFYKYTKEGVFIEDFDIDGVSSLRDLTYDGKYFYGASCGDEIYKMDFENKVLLETFNVNINSIRHLSYDYQYDAFWVGDWSGLQLINSKGEVLKTADVVLSNMYGTAYDGVSEGGPYLWIFDQSGAGVSIYQYDIANETLTDVQHSAEDIPGFVEGNKAGGLCVSVNCFSGKIALLGSIQGESNIVFAYDLGQAPEPWLIRSSTEGIIEPDSDQEVELHFNTAGLGTGNYSAKMHVNTVPYAGSFAVDIEMVVFSGLDDISKEGVTVYPNPTADFVNIKLAGNVRNVSLVNELGQVVRTDSPVNTHDVVFSMSGLEPGVYLVKIILQDNTVCTRKLVLGYR